MELAGSQEYFGHTDKKKKFLIYKEIHNEAVAMSYMRKGILIYTVRKMDLILRCIQRRLQMQLSMARKFTLQPYRR